jgi:hypothetical protein
LTRASSISKTSVEDVLFAAVVNDLHRGGPLKRPER